MTKVHVVGAGLSGLVAAILAAERGADVTLLARGRGGLELSHGCIDIWHDGDLRQELPSIASGHPYRMIGVDAIEKAVQAFLRIVQPSGLGYLGEFRHPLRLPTAVGSLRRTNFAPLAQVSDDALGDLPCLIGAIEGFRDFFPAMIRRNLIENGFSVEGIVELPLPGHPARDVYASDLARLLDREEDAGNVLNAWQRRLAGAGALRLLLPAVLGLRDAGRLHRKAETIIGMPIQEIPTLPPSMPGLRLEWVLWRAADAAGVHLVEGPQITSPPDVMAGAGRVEELMAETAAGERRFPADAIILATGGILNGGLKALQDGRVVETVFGLPVSGVGLRDEWTAERMIDRQPFERFGVKVDAALHPVDADGRVLLENVHVIGGLLGGADRISEGSRQGIDLGSAYRAVEVILG